MKLLEAGSRRRPRRLNAQAFKQSRERGTMSVRDGWTSRVAGNPVLFVLHQRPNYDHRRGRAGRVAVIGGLSHGPRVPRSLGSGAIPDGATATGPTSQAITTATRSPRGPIYVLTSDVLTS